MSDETLKPEELVPAGRAVQHLDRLFARNRLVHLLVKDDRFHDLVAVIRWIDPGAMDGVADRVMRAFKT